MHPGAYRELGADYFDRLKRDQVQWYYVRKLEKTGLKVIIEHAVQKRFSGESCVKLRRHGQKHRFRKQKNRERKARIRFSDDTKAMTLQCHVAFV